MDEQRELKTDLKSIVGAIETQEGVFIPLKEVKRLLLDRIRLVENNVVLDDVIKCECEYNQGIISVCKSCIDSADVFAA
tara:strand:+ start:281 stop:517 length:237 start_codon:yes stop_codon:yes gene_type:complete